MVGSYGTAPVCPLEWARPGPAILSGSAAAEGEILEDGAGMTGGVGGRVHAAPIVRLKKGK